MLFNSYEFVFLFLPATLAGFFAIGRSNARLAAAWLAAASLVFYASWNPRFVALLIASAAANYGFGYALARAPGRGAGALLALSVAANLALLGFFKYANFFIEAAHGLTGGGGPLLDIVLPLGISFFTFTQIAFLVDVRRGIARDYNFVHYLLFVSYFPHLIAGPIIHHRDVMRQFDDPWTYRPRASNFAMGLTLFTLGLAKKVLLADSFAEYANPVFDAARDGERPALVASWAGALSYTLQLYFDFSGYSDMAVGLSLVFGVRLPFNFDSPYKARDIAEFWRRWHMTLSRFLRDYLYIPLGGNRHGRWRRLVNVMVTMVLGGLWHGASWTFVAWGALHGAYLVVHRAWQALRRRYGHEPSRQGAGWGAIALTFLAVVIGWVLFRAADFDAAATILQGMAGLNGVSLPRTLATMTGADALRGSGVAFEGSFAGVAALVDRGIGTFTALLAAGLAIVWGSPNSQQFVGLAAAPPGSRIAWRPSAGMALATAVTLAAAVLHFSKVSTFLYYQF